MEAYVDYLIDFVWNRERDGYDIANTKLELLYDLKEAHAVVFVTKREAKVIASEILIASSVDDLQERLRRIRDGDG